LHGNQCQNIRSVSLWCLARNEYGERVRNLRLLWDRRNMGKGTAQAATARPTRRDSGRITVVYRRPRGKRSGSFDSPDVVGSQNAGLLGYFYGPRDQGLGTGPIDATTARIRQAQILITGTGRCRSS